mgnify:CR=1 FL=1
MKGIHSGQKKSRRHLNAYNTGICISNVVSVSLGVRSPEDIRTNASVIITDSNISAENSQSKRNDGIDSRSVISPYMGSTEYSIKCKSCNLPGGECPGHPGVIVLNTPIKSPIGISQIKRWLNVICSYCGSLIISDPDKTTTAKNATSNVLKEYAQHVDKIPICYACKSRRYKYIIVKEDKYSVTIARSLVPNKKTTNKNDKKSMMPEQVTDIEIKSILSRINRSTVYRFVSHAPTSRFHPTHLMLDEIPVIPITCRPSTLGFGRGVSVSTYTMYYRRVLANNKTIAAEYQHNAMEKKHSHKNKTVNDRNSLYRSINKPNGLTKNMAYALVDLNKTVYSIMSAPASSSNNRGNQAGNFQSLLAGTAGKHGYLRRGIGGRVSGSCMRAVITGSCYLRADEVGISKTAAMELSIPIKVTNSNKNRCAVYVNNGILGKYPAATRVERKTRYGTKVFTVSTSRVDLKEGDLLWRNLITGDKVFFGRQPTLYPASLSGFDIRVNDKVEYFGDKMLTIRMNPIVCPYFNADFDGDLMLILLTMSNGSRMEAKYTGNIKRWVISPQDQSCGIGGFLDSQYNITEISLNVRKFSPEDTAILLTPCLVSSDEKNFQPNEKLGEFVKMYEKYVKEGKSFNTREIISFLLPGHINYEGRPTIYDKAFEKFIDYRDEDKLTVIKHGKLISGPLDKKYIGQGTNGLFRDIILLYVYSQWRDRDDMWMSRK